MEQTPEYLSSGRHLQVRHEVSRGQSRVPSIDFGARWLGRGLWYDRLWSSGSVRRRKPETCLLFRTEGAVIRRGVRGCTTDSGSLIAVAL